VSEESSEETLKRIQEAATQGGSMSFAEDAQSAMLDPEIQQIYQVLCSMLGRTPKRALWCSDESKISDVLPWQLDGQVTPAAEIALARASQRLGISLGLGDLWIEAAQRFRALRPQN
jgi:hypothetical protein